MFGLTEDIRPLLRQLSLAGEPAVLATLIEAQGGSPRGLGAQMLLGRDEVAGYLSGGCVEPDIARRAQEVILSGAPRRLVYGHGGPIDLPLPCGGRIEVLLERLETDKEPARGLLRAEQARLPALWLTDGREQACLMPGEAAPPHLAQAAAAAMAGPPCGQAGTWIFRRFDPVLRLVVVGADPPALAMATLGAQCGLETFLVRPNGPERPPPIGGLTYHRGPAIEALGRIDPDRWTAVIAATHQAEIDDQVLALALASPAFYVGVLGSRRKIEERNRRLRAQGLGDADLARLRAPLGLPLRGKSPWTIALSTISQMVSDLHELQERHGWRCPSTREDQRLDAVVLAAGQASRFGGDKLLAPFGKGVVLDGALRTAFGLGGVVHLVVPPDDRRLTDAGARLAGSLGRASDLHIIRAYDHVEGLAGSLRAAVRAGTDADGLIVLLGDMPSLPTDAAARVGAALRDGAVAAALSQGGQRGHPVGFSRPLFAELLCLNGDRGAGRLLDKLGEALVLIESDAPGLFDDIDTPSDLARLAG